MKKFIALCLLLILAFNFSACGATPESETNQTQNMQQISESTFLPSEATAEGEGETMNTEKQGSENEIMNTEEIESKILVAYFSCTGTTEPLAEYAAEILNADLYEITPTEPYTEADLTYYTNGRADQEQNDPNARPAISGGVENMEQYDMVLIGYPIWHGQAPRIISTFLENYDFTGKTILPFCTSHSSGIGSSDTNLHPLADTAKWLDGRRFAAGTSKEDMVTWLDEMNITVVSTSQIGTFHFESRSVMLNSGYEMPINGLGTYSLHGDECINCSAGKNICYYKNLFGR